VRMRRLQAGRVGSSSTLPPIGRSARSTYGGDGAPRPVTPAPRLPREVAAQSPSRRLCRSGDPCGRSWSQGRRSPSPALQRPGGCRLLPPRRSSRRRRGRGWTPLRQRRSTTLPVCSELFAPQLAQAYGKALHSSCTSYFQRITSFSVVVRRVFMDGTTAVLELHQTVRPRDWAVVMSRRAGGWQAVDLLAGNVVR